MFKKMVTMYRLDSNAELMGGGKLSGFIYKGLMKMISRNRISRG